MHRTRVQQGNYAIVGEIDFAIVGLTGKLLLVGVLQKCMRSSVRRMHLPAVWRSGRGASSVSLPCARDRYRRLRQDPAGDGRLSGCAGGRGQVWWLEDPLRNLCGLLQVQLPGWVTLRSDISYYSSKDVLASLNLLRPLERPVQAGSPLSGSEIDILAYTTSDELVARSVSAITRAIGLGLKRSAHCVYQPSGA